MDLLDRYFRTLRILLPKDQRDDIIRELSEEIRSQVAEKEAELGRALKEEEASAIIGQYGHPLLTAARYRPVRHLIGPIVFPYYWLVLKVIIGLIVVGHVIGAVVLLAGGAPFLQLGQVFAKLVATVVKVLGWITVLAASVDWWLTRTRVLERWNPAVSFPPLVHAARAVKRSSAVVPGEHRPGPPCWSSPSNRRNEGASVSGFVVGVVLSAWLLLGLKFPYLLFGPGAAELSWGPAIARLYAVLAVAQVIALAEHFLRLTQPHGARFVRLITAAWFVTGWFLIYLVATSDHQWVVWHGAAEARARTNIIKIAGLQLSQIDFVNSFFSVVFILVAAGGVFRTLLLLLRWLFRRGHTAAHA